MPRDKCPTCRRRQREYAELHKGPTVSLGRTTCQECGEFYQAIAEAVPDDSPGTFYDAAMEEDDDE